MEMAIRLLIWMEILYRMRHGAHGTANFMEESAASPSVIQTEDSFLKIPANTVNTVRKPVAVVSAVCRYMTAIMMN